LGALPLYPRSTEGYARGTVCWRSARRTCGCGLTDSYGCIAHLKTFLVAGEGCHPNTPAFRCAQLVLQTARYRGQRAAWQVGAAAPKSSFSAALGLSCRRPTTAGNVPLGKWWLPPPHPRFPLRSTCLADGSLSRATKRLAVAWLTARVVLARFLSFPSSADARIQMNPPVVFTGCAAGNEAAWQVGAAAPTSPLSASLGLSCRRLAIAGNEALCSCLADGSLPRATSRLAGGGCHPHIPVFRWARLVLQTARYREQRSALQLPCRRRSTAGNKALSRWGLPPPHFRFPLRSACLADGSLSRATKRFAVALQTARYRGQRSAWQVGAAAPASPLSAGLGLSCSRLAIAGNEALCSCFADGSLPRATSCLTGGGCRPHIPAFRCARLVLQTARYRGQQSAL
jgi:hypothetical protein